MSPFLGPLEEDARIPAVAGSDKTQVAVTLRVTKPNALARNGSAAQAKRRAHHAEPDRYGWVFRATLRRGSESTTSPSFQQPSIVLFLAAASLRGTELI